MNVVYLSKSSFESDSGGGELSADEVSRRLAERGHEVTVFYGQTKADLPRRTTRGNRTIRYVQCLPQVCLRSKWVGYYLTVYLFPFVSLPVLFAHLLDEDVDVVVDNMSPYPTFAIVAGRLTGTPVVGVVHGFFGREMYRTYDPLTATIQLTVQNFLRVFRYARLITPTEAVRRDLIDYGVPERRVTVVPNGVNFEVYAPPDAEAVEGRDPPTDGPVKLLVLGRVTGTKGQETVVRAFERIRAEADIDATLHIVGSGPSLPDVRRLVDNLGLTDDTRIHGWVSEERKVEFLQSSTLFVYASRYESFGIVLLEALAAGLPIVAVEQPAYGDFFHEGRHGRLVEDDPEAVAEATIDVLRSPDYWSASARRDRLDTAREHSWDSIAASTEEVLRWASMES